nr:MAG TPA: hypothetical protein [Caudoviricetes sp.]
MSANCRQIQFLAVLSGSFITMKRHNFIYSCTFPRSISDSCRW